jgi:hypothetical protein
MHAFQACALNHSAISPPVVRLRALTERNRTAALFALVCPKGKLIPAERSANSSILPAKRIDRGKNQIYESNKCFNQVSTAGEKNNLG